MQQVTAEPPPPSATVPGIPIDLEALTLQCLAKDPIIRPAGGDELVVRLDSISERLRVSADPGATVAFGATAATTAMATAAAAGPSAAAADAAPPEPASSNDSPDDQNSNRKWWIAGAITAVLVVAGIALFLLLKPAPQITMPLVVGKDVQTATTIVSNAGFTSSPDLQKVQSNQPKGRVIKQNPLANAKVSSDAKVTLTISDGPGDVQIPTVADLKEAEAQAKLEKLGFKVVVREKTSSDVAKGSAIGTDPAAGVSVVKGTEVTLFVSTGAAPIDVPDVTQQDVASARSTLQGAGFVVTTTNKEVCNQTAGTVVSQSPSGGTKATKGSTVTLVITANDQCVDIPAVTGQTQVDATSALTAAGFKVKIASGSGTGLVVSTNPVEGTSALKGSTVTVTLGS
jgi:serine/threonine-protein kinase